MSEMLTRTFAFIKRDLTVQLSYRFSFVMQFVGLFFGGVGQIVSDASAGGDGGEAEAGDAGACGGNESATRIVSAHGLTPAALKPALGW